MNQDQNHVFPEPNTNQSANQSSSSTGSANQNPTQNSSYQSGTITPPHQTESIEERLEHLRDTHSQENISNQSQSQGNGTNGFNSEFSSGPLQPGEAYYDPDSEIPVYTNPLTPPGQSQGNQDYSNEAQRPTYEGFDINQGQPQVQKTQNKDAKKTNPQAATMQKKIVDFLATKWWVVVVILLVLSLISGGIFYYFNRPANYSQTAFTNVTGRIEAPSTAPSGSPQRWKIVIQNKETVPLRDIEVKLKFDRTFQYIKPINPDPADPSGDTYRFNTLAALGQGTSEVIIQFDGVLTGNIDENTIMSGVISYTPDPLVNAKNNRRTTTIEEARTKITAPEVKVNLTSASDSVQNGGEVTITGTFENLSEKDLKNIRISMDYPSGSSFEYKSSELRQKNADVKTQPDDGRNIWKIPVLPRLQSTTLAVTGNLFGAEGVRQTFRIEISVQNAQGSYEPLATDVVDVLVTSQPLVISTKIEGKDNNKVFAPGDTLNFVVNYQNKSNSTIQNVELFSLIDDPANILDYSTANFVGGSVGNLNNRVVQWRGSGVPQLVTLTPQVSGSVSFTVKVKSGDKFIESGLNQSSYTLRPRAQAKATNIPQFETGGDLYQAKGDLTFNQSITALPKDPNQANKQTFKITWELRTRQNQVNDVTLQTITPLPPTSWKQASIKPADSANELTYDPLTGKIIWNAGAVAAYTGISNPVKTISFELEVVTSSNESIGNVTLIDSATIRGIDDFTGEKYELTNALTKANTNSI